MMGIYFLVIGVLMGSGSVFAFLCKPESKDMYFVCAVLIVSALFCCTGAIVITLEKLRRGHSPDTDRFLR